jgi:hypothetical protein
LKSFDVDDKDDDDVDINRAWGSIRQKAVTSSTYSLRYYKSKQHKAWFHEECSKLIDQREQARFQFLQFPSQTSGDNLKNVTYVTRTCSKEKKEYLYKKKYIQ